MIFKKYFLVEAIFIIAKNNKETVPHLVKARKKEKAESHVKRMYEEKKNELKCFPYMIKARNTLSV